MPPPRGFLLLLLAQIFGVAFFGGRRRKLTFLPLFLLVSYSYLGNFSVKKTRENVAKSLITSEILNLLVSTVNLPLKLPYYYAKRKELEKLVRLVDESVADLRGVSFGSPLRVAAFLVANALLEFASFYPRHGTLFLLTYFTHWSSLYIGCVEHALVSDLLAKLRLRLKLLNGDVLSLLEESRSLAARFKVGRRIGKAGAFEPLLEERLRLLGASERICSLFALPTLLLFGSNLILLVISAHSSITTTKSILLLGGNLKAVTLALTNLYWITAILLHCLSIVDTWGSFRAEVSNPSRPPLCRLRNVPLPRRKGRFQIFTGAGTGRGSRPESISNSPEVSTNSARDTASSAFCSWTGRCSLP